MGATTEGVVSTSSVIVPPKKPAEQVKFRWDPDLIQEVHALARRTNRSINETGEMLMRWAVDRAKTELEMAGAAEAKKKR
jgi:hypothetical protein